MDVRGRARLRMFVGGCVYEKPRLETVVPHTPEPRPPGLETPPPEEQGRFSQYSMWAPLLAYLLH
eukprot:4415107-Lingulodinium_polyedra.AAC.1